MATIKTVSVTYDRKVNLGDYNSAHIGMTLWAELDEGDNEADVADGLRQMARNNVMSEMSRIKPELRAKVQGVFMGLPVSVRECVEEEIGVADYNGGEFYK